MEDKNNIVLQDGSYIGELPDSLEIPVLNNPDDREYEEVKIEVEGGM